MPKSGIILAFFQMALEIRVHSLLTAKQLLSLSINPVAVNVSAARCQKCMECLRDNGAKVRDASRPSPMNPLQHFLSWKAFETKKKKKKRKKAQTFKNSLNCKDCFHAYCCLLFRSLLFKTSERPDAIKETYWVKLIPDQSLESH